ncbi:GXWXG domain-containing protein [Ramlibacter sp. MMS24-I3-19]|uniref:GXWXG domain-containing protein n=1 Tax=Ramlibacter sp. MMS24-I3-19 TaxID=3416606 RepID=UPI003D048852
MPAFLTTQQALALFDGLPAVPLQAAQGAWRGEGMHTGHPLDGLLEACHWHGKRIDGPEHVHPLVFDTLSGGTVCVRPAGVRLGIAAVLRFPALKSRSVGRVVQALLPLLATRRSQARLRMVETRSRSSATIVYDRLPIHDALRQEDANTLLGLMDLKGLDQPLFFRLRRE